jgi:hypothetical protein
MESYVIVLKMSIIASMSLLPQLSSYTGTLLVGLFIPLFLKRKNQMALAADYKMITEGEEEVEVSNINK